MNKYGIFIYWSDEDQLYIAEVPELPGCVTHGDTQRDAVANAEEAIQLWVDTAKEFGNPVPAPVGRPLFFGAARRERSQSEAGQHPTASLPIRRKSPSRVYYDARTRQPRIMNPRTR